MSPNVEISYIWATIPKNRNNEIKIIKNEINKKHK